MKNNSNINRYHYFNKKAKQTGVALISALLLVALSVILTTKMSGRLILQMQRTVNIELNQQAFWYALGAEAFAKSVIKQTLIEDPKVIHLGQYWAQGETSYPVDFGSITGEIFDLQACFNLNALRINKVTNGPSPAPANTNIEKQAFIRLLTQLKLDEEPIDSFQAEYMADALVDWLDSDSDISSAGGAEDNDYAGKAFPYMAANHYLASVNELRVVEHFLPEYIQALKEYVCVIPDSNLHQINVNTLKTEHAILLAALLNISDSEASDILSDRGDTELTKIEDFFTLPSFTGKTITDEQKKQFTVKSEYFKFIASAVFNDSQVALSAIFHAKNKNQINVIARRIGKE